MIQTISDNIPRLDIYEKLGNETALQTALLHVYTDIVEFSLQVLRHIRRGFTMRFGKLMATSLKKDLDEVIKRLRQHAKDADSTAIAVELLRAAQFREEQRLNQRKDLKLRFQTWLNPANIEESHCRNLNELTPGTCEWIWNNTTFKEWAGSPKDSSATDRFLRISGSPGCGKTVLASSLVNKMKKRGDKVVFFSISATDTNRHSADRLVRSLLWQLLQESDSDTSLDIVLDLMSSGPPIASDLWNTLAKLASMLPDPICIVIDGLDECFESKTNLFNRLLDTLATNQASRGILLGRQYAIDEIGPAKYNLEITPELNQTDLNAFIRSAIGSSVNLQSPGISELALDTLQSRSQGMFLWVKFMVHDLNKPSSRAELTERLQNLPDGLQKAYSETFERLINSLDSLDRKFMKDLLSLIIAAKRPMKLMELQYALAVCAKDNDKTDTGIEHYLILDLASRIRNVCESFVQIHDEVVTIAHLSVQEFLTKPTPGEGKQQSPTSLHIDIPESHYLFGCICLDYLSIGTFGNPLTEIQKVEPSEHYALFDYACQNVVYHLNRAEKFAEDMFKKFIEFSNSFACLSWLEHWVLYILNDFESGWDLQEIASFMDWIDDHDHDDNFLKHTGVLIDQEVEKRRSKYDPEDWQNDQLNLLKQFIDQDTREKGKSILQDLDFPGDSDDESTPRVEDLDTAKCLFDVSQLSNDLLNKSFELPKGPDVLPESSLSLTPTGASKNLQATCEVTEDVPETLVKPIKAAPEPNETTSDITSSSTSEGLGISNDINEASKLVDSLSKGGALALPKQIITFVKLQHQLTKLKDLRDPLDMLYNALVQKAKHLPTWVLIPLGDWCNEMRRYDAALKLFQAALAKPKKRAPMEYAITHKIAYTYRLKGKHADAEENFRAAAVGRKMILGPDHEHTLDSLSSLARSLNDQKLYAQAEEVIRVEVDSRVRRHGKEHQETIDAYYDLAWTLIRTKNFEEAEVLYRQVLKSDEGKPGKESAMYLETLSSLAWTVGELGRYEEAKDMYLQVLEGRKKVLVKNHMNIWLSISDLAWSLGKLKEYEESARLFRQALDGLEKKIGNENETVYANKHDLANVLSKMEKYDEAAELFQQSYLGRQKLFGKAGSVTMASMANLAWNLYRTEDKEKGLDLDYQILKLLIPEDPDAMLAMDRIAEHLRKESKLEASEEMYHKIISLRKRVSGEEDEATLISTSNLAQTLRDAKKYVEAEEIDHRVFEIQKRVLGQSHEGTLASLFWYAWDLQYQERWEEAKALLLQELEIRQAKDGEDDRKVIGTIGDIAFMCFNQKHYTEAEKWYRRELASRDKLSAKGDRHTILTLENLANTLGWQGKTVEQINLHRRIVYITTELNGEGDQKTLEAMYLLAIALFNDCKQSEAEKICRQILKNKTLDDDFAAKVLGLLINCLYGQRKYMDEEVVRRQKLEIRIRQSGKNHEETINEKYQLGCVLYDREEYKEAADIFTEVVSWSEKHHGLSDTRTMDYMRMLEFTLRCLGEISEAESVLRKLLRLRKDTNGMVNYLTRQARTELNELENQMRHEKSKTSQDSPEIESAAVEYELGSRSDSFSRLTQEESKSDAVSVHSLYQACKISPLEGLRRRNSI
jgi:tetratricopeptide (TPR) repeat protein